MAQQNVEIVRSGYDAFNRQDIPAVLALYDEQIEWVEGGGGRAPSGTFRGPQAVGKDVFATVPGNFDEFRADPEQFIDAGGPRCRDRPVPGTGEERRGTRRPIRARAADAERQDHTLHELRRGLRVGEGLGMRIRAGDR